MVLAAVFNVAVMGKVLGVGLSAGEMDILLQLDFEG